MASGLLAGLAVGPSAAAPPDPAPGAERGFRSRLESFLELLKDNRFGSFYLGLRPRYEYANREGALGSHALTLRGVFGFGSRTWRGFSFLVEGEGTAVIEPSWYFDGIGAPNGRTLVPDPPNIDLNQAYLHYERSEWTTELRLGRQRLILDDARFVGNVGWRQNEQTFDAAHFATGFGRRDLRLQYSYLGQVLRVFGDTSRDALSSDFDSSSHLVNLRWSGFELLQASFFAYLLDFANSPENSSNTYGLRATGALDLGDPWALRYAFSYAYQTEAGANPVDYGAHYAWLEAALDYEPAGELGIGFELLGSDDGVAGFGTPLGTIHNFNGYADAFLDNGGSEGLRDLFVRVLPALPLRLDGELAFHHFWADFGGAALGWEIDAVLSRPVGSYAVALLKTAYFQRSDPLPSERPSVFRVWLQLSFEF